MPRAPLVRTPDFAYHLTARTNNRDWFYLEPAESWPIFCRVLSRSAAKYKVNVHAFVMMSNHFHLIAATPNGNVDCFMRHFMTETCRAFQRRTGRTNHMYGDRYRPSVLSNALALACAYKYLYRNPVRAGMCQLVEQYPFSTLPVNRRKSVPLCEGFDGYWSLIPKDFSARLKWLNDGSEHEKLISKALRRSRFKFSTDAKLRAPLRKLQAQYLIAPGESR